MKREQNGARARRGRALCRRRSGARCRARGPRRTRASTRAPSRASAPGPDSRSASGSTAGRRAGRSRRARRRRRDRTSAQATRTAPDPPCPICVQVNLEMKDLSYPIGSFWVKHSRAPNKLETRTEESHICRLKGTLRIENRAATVSAAIVSGMNLSKMFFENLRAVCIQVKAPSFYRATYCSIFEWMT